MADFRISQAHSDRVSEAMKGNEKLSAQQALGGNVNEAFQNAQRSGAFEKQNTANEHLPSLSLDQHDSSPQNAAPDASVKKSR